MCTPPKLGTLKFALFPYKLTKKEKEKLKKQTQGYLGSLYTAKPLLASVPE